MTATGWTWEYIDEQMTFARFKSMTAYWKEYPPTHIGLSLVLSALGAKKMGAPTRDGALLDEIKNAGEYE